MKKSIFLLVAAIALSSCKNETKKPIDGYRVIGEAPGVHNGIRIYLNTVGNNGRPVAKDTAIVMNETFTFDGNLDTPEMVMLSVNSVSGNLPFVLERQEIKLKINKDDITASEITGTKANEAITEYHSTVKEISTSGAELRTKYQNAGADAELRKELSKQIVENNQKKDSYPFDFLKANNDNYFALILIENLLKERKRDINRIAECYEKLSNDLKNTTRGKTLKTQIEGVEGELAALGATELGKIAPNFTAPSPEGKALELKNMLGKVTIVDFWAAWCGPCRRENPNVVKIYEKYHDKGLEIVGVSLDGSRRQKNPKDAWIKAIEDDKLTWNHVSNLNYFDDPIAKAYNIRSIPATFILDEEGRIIEKNLRGAALEDKIAELLN